MKLSEELLTKLKSINVDRSRRVEIDFKCLKDGINIYQLYTDVYNVYPNVNTFLGIDPEEFLKLILGKYYHLIVDFSFRTINVPSRNMAVQKEFLFHLKPDLIIRVNPAIEFAYKHTEFGFIEELIEDMKQLKRKRAPRVKPTFELLTYSGESIKTTLVEVKVPNLSIENSYNDDFIEVDHKVRGWIEKKDSSGLLLLHGKPGTGKTSYLRHLMVKLKTNFIYISAAMGHSLSSPYFTEFLADNSNSVIIIEDAEKLLLDRENNQSSDVSSILNFCDGLLSDAFNIKIICSFNMPYTKIDKALLRRGRLFGMYEFKELSTQKCTDISAILGHNKKYLEPTLLTNVCNPEEVMMNELKPNVIGFSFQNRIDKTLEFSTVGTEIAV